MITLKKIIYSIILISTFALSSCSDFLIVGPTNALPEATAVVDVPGARVALNGVYRSMHIRQYYGTDMITYGEVRGDDQGTTLNGDRTQNAYHFGHLTAQTSTNAGFFWRDIYHSLARVNNLMERIEANTISVTSDAEQATLDDVYGQLLALRALMHFDLVRIYGEPYLKNREAPGVIIANRVILGSERLQRATVGATYDFIVEDLQRALGRSSGKRYLKREIDPILSHAGMSYYPAEALLSKVYLYMGRWSDSYDAATNVIKSGPYRLISNGDYVTSWGLEFTSESIFEVHSSATANADREGIGYVTLPRIAAVPGAVTGYGAVSATSAFIELMKEDMDDVRLGIMKTNDRGIEFAYIAKYPGRGDNVYVNNTRVLRLSEIYLIAAEAGVLAGKADASDYLNAIRKRANPAVADVVATVELVMKERRKELIGEGHRFFDIIRNLGTNAVRRGGTASYPIDQDYMVPMLSWNNAHTYLLILPIPQAEIDVNKDIYQNAGYPRTN
jgi:hypothetical protein